MTVHPLVTQLRFCRSEFMRCLEGVSEEDALRRLEPMNCLSWMVGHLADQENRYWNMIPQGLSLWPGLNERVGWHKPASLPTLSEMRQAWTEITAAADPYLDTLDPQILQTYFEWKGKTLLEPAGTMLQRNIYHYWFHTGEAYALRQMLGHHDLPEFVGDMSQAGYRPEAG